MDQYQALLFWVQCLASLLFFGYMIQRYAVAVRTRPKIRKDEIVYQEWFASGSSQKNILTRFGGASGCLRLVVTKDLLWVTAWFPFTVFAALYDMVHVIPLRRISAVASVRSRFLGVETLLLTYLDDAGKSHSLRLAPKAQVQFLDALRLDGKPIAALPRA